MKICKNLCLLTLVCGLLPGLLHAAEEDDYDYFAANRLMIRNGVQAILTCNGLFTSHRTLEQVYAQELAYLVAWADSLAARRVVNTAWTIKIKPLRSAGRMKVRS